jgi:hypothetical protein
MESLIRNIDELSSTNRQAVESLIGHSVVNTKGQVLLVLIDELTAEQRNRWDQLIASISPFHANVAATGAAPGELEDEIDQTIAEVRSGQP